MSTENLIQQFLTKHNPLDVLDVVQDAATTYAFQGQKELQQAVDKEDFKSIAADNWHGNVIMQELIQVLIQLYKSKK